MSTLTTTSQNIPKNNAPNPSTSVFTFFLITLFYFIAKYKTPDSMATILNIIYIIAIVSTQISINTALAKSICNNTQSMNVGILATIFPMLFIFGLLQMLLNIFPGWIEPFSNTFGYGISKLVGLNDLIKRLIRSVPNDGNGNNNNKIIDAVNSIYSDPSIFINQFSYADKVNFNRTWDNSYSGGKGIFVSSASVAPTTTPDGTTLPGSKLYEEFRDMVKLKDIVGTFFWYILVGVIVTSKSYNYIISQPCSLNASVSQKAVDSYIKSTVAAPKTIDKLTPDGFSYKLN